MHRTGRKSPQGGHFGRLPNSGFRRNVNRPRDTAARKSGETRGSRRTGPALGSRVTGDLRIVTDTGPDQGFEAGFRPTPRGTGSGSEDGAGQTCGTRPDQSRRIQPTVTGVRSADAQARVPTSMAKSNPDLARARNATVRPGGSCPRSIPARTGVRAGRKPPFPSRKSGPKPWPCAARLSASPAPIVEAC